MTEAKASTAPVSSAGAAVPGAAGPSCICRRMTRRNTHRAPQGEPGPGGEAAFFLGSLLRTRHCWGEEHGQGRASKPSTRWLHRHPDL